ncbi:MAG: hypothetical protein K6B75_08265, partial [Lachnospiraceae bacterium]|nr:hypothetical protein [Lachnospiraceae bacterium]
MKKDFRKVLVASFALALAVITWTGCDNTDKKEAVNNTPTPTPIVYENRTAEDVRIESTKL